jgi:hypothetical protein
VLKSSIMVKKSILNSSMVINESARSDRVCIHKSISFSATNNLRVIFRVQDNVVLVSFKNCGFHIKAKRNRVKIHFDFSVKRNQLYVRCRDDDDDDDDESNGTHNKRGIIRSRTFYSC